MRYRRHPTPPRVYSSATDYVVRRVPSKPGLALTARRALAPNTRLVCEGRAMTHPQYLARIATGGDARYIVGLRRGEYIDCKPSPRSGWVAGRVNEPARNETANMLLVHERGPPMRAVLVTVRRIEAGEELLLHYGSSYHRTYRVGRRARRPVWL